MAHPGAPEHRAVFHGREPVGGPAREPDSTPNSGHDTWPS